MQVRYKSGRRVEALILAASRYQMRVVVEGFSETEEWENRDGVWHDEKDGQIEIEALIAVEGTGWSAVCAELGTRSMAMGVMPY